MGIKFWEVLREVLANSRVRNEVFRECIGIYNTCILLELEKKLLQWFGHENWMHTTIPRSTLEIKFKGKRPMRWPRTRWFARS
jgi:hypothetical protein